MDRGERSRRTVGTFEVASRRRRRPRSPRCHAFAISGEALFSLRNPRALLHSSVFAIFAISGIGQKCHLREYFTPLGGGGSTPLGVFWGAENGSAPYEL